MTNSERLAYIDIAKGIGIILVVIGHCVPDASSLTGISNPYFKLLHQIIYSFHMPLFFFIAGFFVNTQKFSVSSPYLQKTYLFIRKKFNRLIVPYLFVGLCYLPLKLAFSQFANRPYHINNLWKIIIGINPDGELWFLYSLFMINVLVAVVFKFKVSLWKIMAALLAMLSPFCHIITNYLLYFLIGMYIREKEENWIYKFSSFFIVICLALFFAGNYALYLYPRYSVWIKILTSLSGIVLCLWTAKTIGNNSHVLSRGLRVLGEFSMDIYILSDIIKIPFRIIFWNKLHMYYSAFIICTVMSILLSFMISKYFIRTNPKLKRLILGM